MANQNANKVAPKSRDPPRTATQLPRAQDAPALAPPSEPAINGKKKKKKKGKGKAAAGGGGGNIANPAVEGEEDDDEDGLPPLEPANDIYPNNQPAAPPPLPPPHLLNPKTGSRTGLSPDLESVHISTTASLAATIASTPNELMNTAQDLYRRIDTNESMMIPEDSDYWTTLPPAIRSFVQNAYAQGALTGGTDPDRAHAMYTIAQHMINSGQTGPRANNRQSSSPYPPGAYPSFDAALFSDPAFTQALEQLIPTQHAHRFPNSNSSHPVPPPPGQPPQGPLPPTNVVLLNEFGGDEQQYEEDYYSEDDEEADGDPDAVNGRHASAQFTLSYGADGRPRTTAAFTQQQKFTSPTGAPGKANPPPLRSQPPVDSLATDATKKNKKKKKKRAAAGDGAAQAPALPATQQPQRESVNIPIQSSAPQTTAPPPSRPAPVLHPPSSRAAGKQPMSYAPATTPAPAPPNPPLAPPRSSRAASKAPATGGGHYHHGHHHPSPPSSNATTAPNKPRPPAAAGAKDAQKPKNLWSTNTTEERERIKEFWLGLGEDERRQLVKIEKEAVLRKMKDQQKHSCSCAVCGRKRSAIEEELEVLYDAYYDELEQYANYQQRYVSSGGKLPPPPGPGPFPGSVELDKNGAVVAPGSGSPPKQQQQQQQQQPPHPQPPEEEEYEDDEDEYEDDSEDAADEDDMDDEEADEPPADDARLVKGARQTYGPGGHPPNAKNVNGVNGAKQVSPPPRQDFFNFGSGLTVAGNILTVADDLLKNDGQKFLEMMEQLAERRMVREEAAAADVMTDEESEEEEGSEEDESEDDEEDDEDEDEMTEEQKMEEGKRMFSIFAARMFEQRVLQAYREKVAQERQMQLLRELEEEDKLNADREAKKAKENQKKKDKKKQQKQAKDEERARREAERQAEEAALKAKQEAQEEEARRRREEERTRREAERKTKEEERKKKEEEKRKRLNEEKEREAERKEKALKEKERLKKEREEREAKERERAEKARIEKAERAEREAEKAKEEAAKREREREQREKEEKEKQEREKERLAALPKPAKPIAIAPPVAAPVPAPSRAQAPRANGPSQPAKKVAAKASTSLPTPSSSSPASSTMTGRPTLAPLQSPPPFQTQRAPPPNVISAPPSRRPTMLATPQTPMSASMMGMPSTSHPQFAGSLPGMSPYGPPSPVATMSLGGPSQFGMQGSPQVPHLQPSAMPRGFGPNAMDYHPPLPPLVMPQMRPARGLPSPGPNQIPPTPGAGPNGMIGMNPPNFSPGPVLGQSHVRRASLDPIAARSSAIPPFGAITRPAPIAPIGTRPSGASLPIPSGSTLTSSAVNGLSSSASTTGTQSDADDRTTRTSTSSSPLRRSPEPGRLGSSALVDPEDEPLPSTGGRRTGVMGSIWAAPPGDMSGKAASWGTFGSRPNVGPGLSAPAHLPQPQGNVTWGVGTVGINPWSPNAGNHLNPIGVAPFISPPGMGLGNGLSAVSSIGGGIPPPGFNPGYGAAPTSFAGTNSGNSGNGPPANASGTASSS